MGAELSRLRRTLELERERGNWGTTETQPSQQTLQMEERKGNWGTGMTQPSQQPLPPGPMNPQEEDLPPSSSSYFARHGSQDARARQEEETSTRRQARFYDSTAIGSNQKVATSVGPVGMTPQQQARFPASHEVRITPPGDRTPGGVPFDRDYGQSVPMA